MTDQERPTEGDDLLEETKVAKRQAEILIAKYTRIRKDIEKAKKQDHILESMMETLGG